MSKEHLKVVPEGHRKLQEVRKESNFFQGECTGLAGATVFGR